MLIVGKQCIWAIDITRLWLTLGSSTDSIAIADPHSPEHFLEPTQLVRSKQSEECVKWRLCCHHAILDDDIIDVC